MNYFELNHLLDAARPTDGSTAPVYRKTMRSCLPGGGIEVELEDTPVFICNRWEPAEERLVQLRAVRERYLASPAGIAYVSELATWEEEREKEAAVLGAELDGTADADQPSVLAQMQAEMATDRSYLLELRRAGKTELLCVVGPDDTEASLTSVWGAGPYQLRLVLQHKNQSVISSIRTIELSKETV